MVEQIDRENEALQEWAEEGRRMDRGITEAVAAERARMIAAMRDRAGPLQEASSRALCVLAKCNPDDLYEGSPIWDHWQDEAWAALSAAADHMEASQ